MTAIHSRNSVFAREETAADGQYCCPAVSDFDVVVVVVVVAAAAAAV